MDFNKENIKQFLDENQIDIFSVNDLRKNFTSVNRKEFYYALYGITNLEFSKIEKGKYCRNTFRNEYVIGSFLTSDATIAYWSALNIHGLTEQIPNKVFVQTTKKKQSKEIFGVFYQFVKVRSGKMTGIIKTGTGTNQFRITDIEKTIVDCFDLPDYSGGFMELVRAFKQTKMSSQKMIAYLKSINNKSAAKRIGYLAELFDKKGFKGLIKYAKQQRSKNYDLLDIYGSKEGKYNSGWRLIINIEKDDLLDIANSIY